LGKIYTPDLLEAFSSDVNRTKASLQLVLAGLFPPVEEQIWETGLNWQPIPFSTLPLDQDLVRGVIFIDQFPIDQFPINVILDFLGYRVFRFSETLFRTSSVTESSA
jgi:hypothetical protein